jgi:hypothetical protein
MVDANQLGSDEGFKRGGWLGHIGDRSREEAAKVVLDEALGRARDA